MKATDYLKGFSLTNEIVPIEELRSFVQMQKLVSDYPIPFLRMATISRLMKSVIQRCIMLI